ncbi:hypothetical protein BBP40_002541 [Aspergillus hancockii]|nr:hypothetical protein BBP40_002541 [Aspergillus hancockii]
MSGLQCSPAALPQQEAGDPGTRALSPLYYQHISARSAHHFSPVKEAVSSLKGCQIGRFNQGGRRERQRHGFDFAVQRTLDIDDTVPLMKQTISLLRIRDTLLEALLGRTGRLGPHERNSLTAGEFQDYASG